MSLMSLDYVTTKTGHKSWRLMFEDDTDPNNIQFEVAWLHHADEDPLIRRFWQRFVNGQPICWEW